MSARRPQLPWRIKLFISTLSFGIDLTRRKDGSVNRRLMSFFDAKVSPSPTKPRKNGVKTTDITVDKARNLWFRLYTPTPTSASAPASASDDVTMPVIYFCHGGGFVFMGPDSKPYDDFYCQLADELQAVIISVNYRLAPEHRFPAQYDDCFDVMKFVDNELPAGSLPEFADLKKSFIAGDSAGGNLAHHVAVRASECEVEFSRTKLVGVIAIQPFFGGEERVESEKRLVDAPFVTVERVDLMWKSFLPEGSNKDHPASNVFGPNSGDISGLNFPATLVIVGGFDPLQDWEKGYYQGLKNLGKEAYLVEYPNAIHTFYAYPELPESKLFIKEVKDFMGNLIESADRAGCN